MSDALSRLGQQVRSADPDRFYAVLFAPVERREALFALLAFNHEIARVREIVSEGVIGQMRLAWWQETLDEIETGRAVRAHPVAAGLAAAYRAHPFSLARLNALVDARVFDLYDDPMPDLAALAAYAHATGGALHGAMAEVLGGSAAQLAASEAVGTAWALTGIIRALRIHAARRQLYLPLDELARHGVTPEEIFAGQASDGLRGVIGEIVTLAKDRFALAKGTKMGPALPAAMPGALLNAYWRRMTSRGFDAFRMPSDPSPITRMALLLMAGLRGEI